MSKLQVVILGGGFAGAATAKLLDEANSEGKFEISLVSPREGFLLMKYGAIRGAVVGEGPWVDRTLIPTTHLFQKNSSGRVIRGAAASVNEFAKTVTLRDGTVLQFDILVIATGSTSFSCGEPPGAATSVQETKDYYKDFKTNFLAGAKNVLVVGSGPVGLELCGEIRHFIGPEVALHVVTKTSEILSGPVPLHKVGVQSMERLVLSQGVKFYYNDELEWRGAALPFVKVPAGQVTLKSGKTVQCDLLLFAAGVRLNTAFLPAAWVDSKTTEVVVDPRTLRVLGRFDVFALGDCARTGFTKLGYVATQDAQTVAANVLQALQRKAATNVVKRMPMMVVPFGPEKGRTILPFATLGNWSTSKLKGAHLFAPKMWQSLGLAKEAVPRA